jgi:hypothetical protein
MPDAAKKAQTLSAAGADTTETGSGVYKSEGASRQSGKATALANYGGFSGRPAEVLGGQF